MVFSEIIKTIKEANHILICPGNGMTMDCGMPDFVVDNYFAEKQAQGIQEIPQANWYVDDPSYDLGYLAYRMEVYNSFKPHPGYLILKKLVEKKDYFIFTSCTEGFASEIFPEDKIFEVHGNFRHWHCTDSECLQPLIYRENCNDIEYDRDTFRAKEPFPTCPTCGKLVRPNICLSNDWNFNTSRFSKQKENYEKWLGEIKPSSKLVILEIGAGVRFPTLRDNSEDLVQKLDATLVRINLNDCKVPSLSFGIAMKAGEALEQISALL